MVSFPSTRKGAAALRSTEAESVPICGAGDQESRSSPSFVAELQATFKRYASASPTFLEEGISCRTLAITQDPPSEAFDRWTVQSNAPADSSARARISRLIVAESGF